MLKHLKAWSFRTLEGERRANLLYRRFTRFDADRIPTYATFSRTFALLGPALTTQIQQRTVQQARQGRGRAGPHAAHRHAGRRDQYPPPDR